MTETTTPKEPVETSEYSTGLSALDYKEFAQQRRMNFIQKIEEGSDGQLHQLEPDVQGHYLAALRDIEKQVLVIDKMKQDKHLAELRLKAEQQNTEAINQNIAVLLNEAARKRGRGLEETSNTDIVMDISLVPQKALIPGETTLGDQIETYQQFQSRTGLVENPDP